MLNILALFYYLFGGENKCLIIVSQPKVMNTFKSFQKTCAGNVYHLTLEQSHHNGINLLTLDFDLSCARLSGPEVVSGRAPVHAAVRGTERVQHELVAPLDGFTLSIRYFPPAEGRHWVECGAALQR